MQARAASEALRSSSGEAGAGGRIFLQAFAGVEGEAAALRQQQHGPAQVEAGGEPPAGGHVGGQGAEVGGGLVGEWLARLAAADKPFQLAQTASDDDIAAAEETLGIPFPPSYRQFLRKIGGPAIPPPLRGAHPLVRLSPPPPCRRPRSPCERSQ